MAVVLRNAHPKRPRLRRVFRDEYGGTVADPG
jgi:hypothetical protein